MSVPFTVKGVIYDSGASLIYMPSGDFKGLMAQITLGKSCTVDTSAKTYCPCTNLNDTSFPSVVFKTGQATLTLQSNAYLLKSTSTGICQVGIKADDSLTG